MNFDHCTTREQLAKEVEKLKSGGTLNEYCGIIASMLRLGISDKVIADTLEVSCATIHRWAMVKNAPHPFLRKVHIPIIYNLLSGVLPPKPEPLGTPAA